MTSLSHFIFWILWHLRLQIVYMRVEENLHIGIFMNEMASKFSLPPANSYFSKICQDIEFASSALDF